MLLLRTLNPVRPGKEGPYDTFLAGLLGGYTVFGRGKQGSVNQQVRPGTLPLEALERDLTQRCM